MVSLFDPTTRTSPPRLGDKLSDPAVQATKLGPLADKRDKALSPALAPVEDLVRTMSPLPASYDVSRTQPPYFSEFTYTELFGCLYVNPQSTEAAARMAAMALADDSDAHPWFEPPAADKYEQTAGIDAAVRKIVFLPGNNIFKQIVSRDALTRAMRDDPDLYLKPHPLSDEELLRMLGREFGYHRVLRPDASGADYLSQATDAYVTTSTQMGLYAVLDGKRIHNIGVPSYEARGAYFPLYRLLWGHEHPDDALISMLSSPFSGVFHPDDWNLAARIGAYFDAAMGLRDTLKPFVEELTPPQWADALSRGAPA